MTDPYVEIQALRQRLRELENKIAWLHISKEADDHYRTYCGCPQCTMSENAELMPDGIHVRPCIFVSIGNQDEWSDISVLSSSERWVIREALSLHQDVHLPLDNEDHLVYYVIHKCEKNSVSAERCRYLLDLFDLHNDHTDPTGCPVCARLAEYQAAQ